jgi:dTDP-4-amino-4,6-dideoxygalactose transaminase
MTSGTASVDVGVPFLDLAPSHRPLKDAVLADIGELIDSGAFTNGPPVAEFEVAFAAFTGTTHCVGVASGLDALRLGLLADGIEPGDEVIVPADTFIATFEAISQVGGVPVPVDVTESDYNLDPEAVEAAIGPRTRFLLPVHLYGQLADMRALLALAGRHGLSVHEDACQAHGATRAGLSAGEAGRASSFSFYPGKNLGAFGDAGALVTNDEQLAGTVRALREHGQREKYKHRQVGFTARLDTIQAIALVHKLPQLARWNDERRQQAAFYNQALAGVGDLVLPPVAADSQPVWHLYPIRTADPVALADFLRESGIGTGRHYPEPPHLSEAYRGLGLTAGSFPVTESLAREVLSLPVFPGLTQQQLDAVATGVRAYFDR